MTNLNLEALLFLAKHIANVEFEKLMHYDNNDDAIIKHIVIKKFLDYEFFINISGKLELLTFTITETKSNVNIVNQLVSVLELDDGKTIPEQVSNDVLSTFLLQEFNIAGVVLVTLNEIFHLILSLGNEDNLIIDKDGYRTCVTLKNNKFDGELYYKVEDIRSGYNTYAQVDIDVNEEITIELNYDNISIINLTHDVKLSPDEQMDLIGTLINVLTQSINILTVGV